MDLDRATLDAAQFAHIPPLLAPHKVDIITALGSKYVERVQFNCTPPLSQSTFQLLLVTLTVGLDWLPESVRWQRGERDLVVPSFTLVRSLSP